MMIYGHDAEVIEWVGKRLDCNFESTDKAIGIARNGKIVAGVVYHNYRPGFNIEMSIASITPRWATKEVLRALFSYPFIQLGLPRVTGIAARDNASVRRFDERLGFVKEGIMRNAHSDGDAVIYGMLKNECKYIEDSPNG